MTAGTLYYATNRLNAVAVLSRSVILPLSSYEKYYSDLLEHAPAWLPLFFDGVSSGVAEALCNEETSAFPVLIELSALELDLDAMPTMGADDDPGSALALAVRSAIPVINPVLHFRSKVELDEFVARPYNNMDPGLFNLKVSPGLFEAIAPDYPEVVQWLESLPGRDTPFPELYLSADLTFGAAVMAMQGTTDSASGAIAAANAEELFDSGEANALPKAKSNEHLLGLVGPAAGNAWLFRRVFEVISEGPAGPRDSPRLFVDELTEGAELPGAIADEVTTNLDRVKRILLGDSLFKRFKPGGLGVAKALLLFLLQPEPLDVLRWRHEDTGATAGELALAAAFSGASRRHSGLPIGVRGEPALRDLVSAASADWINAALASSLPRFVIKAPKIKVAVIEDDPGWNKIIFKTGKSSLISHKTEEPTIRGSLLRADLADDSARGLARDLAATMGWLDCLRTVVTFEQGEIKHEHDKLILVIFGPSSSSTDLDVSRFRERLIDAKPAAIEQAHGSAVAAATSEANHSE